MSRDTCFVIMPIGNCSVAGGATISSEELRSRYDNLIKEAVAKCRPMLAVERADDVAAPGTITTDILTRLMHADYVIADVTFPNPNVFYELGIRHTCRPGTIIIRERGAPPAPFDISSLRYIEYEHSLPGLHKLATDLDARFKWFEQHRNDPDNHVLELARVVGYKFQNYTSVNPEDELIMAMLSVMQSPSLMDVLMRSNAGELVDQSELFKAMADNPEAAIPLMRLLAKGGHLNLNASISRPSKADKTQPKPGKNIKRRG